MTSVISFAEQVTVGESLWWGKRALVISRIIIVLLGKESIHFPLSDSFLKYQQRILFLRVVFPQK